MVSPTCRFRLCSGLYSETVAFANHCFSSLDPQDMAQAVNTKLLVGPYGLHVVVAVIFILFAAFLWIFNFTTFF